MLVPASKPLALEAKEGKMFASQGTARRSSSLPQRNDRLGLVSVSRNAIHGSEKLRPAHTQAKRMTPPALTSLKTKKPVPEVILF